MKPAWDIREAEGIVQKEKKRIENEKKEKEVSDFLSKMEIKFVQLPGKKLNMLNTEVTQQLYESIMGNNPSRNKGKNNPVEKVSWYDAIYFCNKLSKKFGYTPVYEVDGKTDVTTWNYTPHKSNSIGGKVTQNTSADGFRLPTKEEWEYAAKGVSNKKNYNHDCSKKTDDIGWFDNKTHPVAHKKANKFGLYDMWGNVWEWVWGYIPDIRGRCYSGGAILGGGKIVRGGIYLENGNFYGGADSRTPYAGFRIVQTVNKQKD